MRAGEPDRQAEPYQAETQNSASLVTVTGEAVFTSDTEESSSGAGESSHDARSSTLSADPRVRRAQRKQRPRRRAEQRLCCGQVAGACKLVASGATWRRAAACLDVPERTLRHWRQGQGVPCSKLRGRPVLVTTVRERNEVFRFFEGVTGPMIGLPTLRALFPKMPCVVLASMLIRYRRWWRNKHAVHGHRLTWHVAGAAWAMDFTKTQHSIDGKTQIIFTVRDLASHYHLCWVPVEDEKAQTIIPILNRLFREHGPPLVLKSDNGSAFIAEEALELLKDWQVLPLFSPPRQPNYNGALERSNTTLKVYTHTSAVSDGHPFRWTSDDLAQALTVANELTRPWGANGETPAERWRSRARIGEHDRRQLLDLVEAQREVARDDLGLSDKLSASDHRAVDRMAISRSLQQLGHLTATPVRRSASKPKRPDSEHRERWFEQRSGASSAAQSTSPALRDTKTDPPAHEKKTLAQNDEGVTMLACPAVSAPSAAAPHDLPPEQCTRAIFTWLRRPITLLISLAKAARVS